MCVMLAGQAKVGRYQYVYDRQPSPLGCNLGPTLYKRAHRPGVLVARCSSNTPPSSQPSSNPSKPPSHASLSTSDPAVSALLPASTRQSVTHQQFSDKMNQLADGLNQLAKLQEAQTKLQEARDAKTDFVIQETSKSAAEASKAAAEASKAVERLTDVCASTFGCVVEALARSHQATKLNVDPERLSAVEVNSLHDLAKLLDDLLEDASFAPSEHKGVMARMLAEQLCKEGWPQRLLHSIGLRVLKVDWAKRTSSQANNISSVAGSSVAGTAPCSSPADSSTASSGAAQAAPDIDVPKVFADIKSNGNQPLRKAVSLLGNVCSRLQDEKLGSSVRLKAASKLLCTTGAGIECALAAAMPNVYMPSPGVGVGVTSSSSSVSSSASEQLSSPDFPPISVEMDMRGRAVYNAETHTLRLFMYEVKSGADVKQATEQLRRQLRLLEWAISHAAPSLTLQLVGHAFFLSRAETRVPGFEESCQHWQEIAAEQYKFHLQWSIV